jgi:hypothetical protein
MAALKDLPISSFVASLMSARDTRCNAAAIQMAEILMQKLPGVFTNRESAGVVVVQGQRLPHTGAAGMPLSSC